MVDGFDRRKEESTMDWLNRKVAEELKQNETLNLSSYFNSLNLKLTSLSSQMKDACELKAAHFLSCCPQIVKEAKSMDQEVQLIKQVLLEGKDKGKKDEETIEELYQEMTAISVAQEKVETVRRALKRQTYRI
jgi:hypothetical protein